MCNILGAGINLINLNYYYYYKVENIPHQHHFRSLPRDIGRYRQCTLVTSEWADVITCYYYYYYYSFLGGGGLWQNRTKHWTAVRSQTVITLFNVSYAVHIHHLGILWAAKEQCKLLNNTTMQINNI